MNTPPLAFDHVHNWPAPKVRWKEIPVEQGEILGRILDPVRAAALHEAVFAWRGFAIPERPEEDPAGEIIAVAERFEAWLAKEQAG
jgi:hypothetical protein